MQAPKLLHNVFAKNIPSVHKKRLDCINDGVSALLKSKKLTLTALGRHCDTNAVMRSNIRKFDRLLGNQKLHAEIPQFYMTMNSQFWPTQTRPWIHVDWSCLSSKQNLYVLRASLSMQGRGLVVYEEVHDKAKENHHPTHKVFLHNLKKVLPASQAPVLVTDAGFRGKWFKEVRRLGYDFIGRLRNNNLVKLGDQQSWMKSKSLYNHASTTPKHLGSGLLTLRNKLACQFVIYKGKKKYRKKLTKTRKISRASKSRRHALSGEEPWLLVTSLNDSRMLANHVVRIYSQRMQIEENFRDTKSQRYGFGLNESGTKTPARMAVLLLLAAIATLSCWLVGLTVKRNGKAANYQAHSSSFTSVLSIVYLGCEAIRSGYKIVKYQFYEALRLLCQLPLTEGAGYES